MTHEDVEYHVSTSRSTTITDDLGVATQTAMALGISSGKPVTLDIVIWSEEGARAFKGDFGVEQYNEDPDASVFERIVITAQSLGRIA